jgi:CHAT domain-containing protein
MTARPERSYGWVLREFGAHPVRATEEQEHGPFIDALREAASFVTGRVPVTAAFGGGEAGVTAWQGKGDWPTPRFAAAVPADPATTVGAGTTVRSAATTALTAVTERHWAYVARVARGETSGLREAAGLVRPEPGTALVEFAITSGGTVTYAVTAGGDLDADPLPAIDSWAAPVVFTTPAVATAELTSRLTGPDGWKAAYEFRSRDGGAAWRTALDSALSWLHAQLFQPLEPWLRARGVRRLLVVPHRGLHLLPVTAWWCRRAGRRRYVLDDYEVCFAPSLTLLQICAERCGQASASGRPLALLDPTGDLPLTRLDALALGANLAPDRVFAGPAATAAQWRAAGTDASLAHYAGHARYDWDKPLDSAIPLYDGTLTLGEMFDDEMPLRPAAEISLLGCETSMTDPRDLADEYLGLASGFLFAGASSVLSTLWAVQEAPAMLLSARYYSERQRGARPSAALRAAQQWLRTAGPADIRRTANHADDLERLGLLNDAIRDALPRIRQPARPWGRRPFAHPIVWGAYTATAH